MAEKNNMEMFSALMGQQGQDTLQMLQRMERLNRLIGSQKPAEVCVMTKKEEPADLFSRSRQESMISAAIPFLDREYQREIYVIVRLMEMRRVLEVGFLETREKQEELPAIRRKNLLQAVHPYLPESEQKQMETLLKMMTVKELMGQGEKK
ncbi:hypothetical protein [Anaerotignum sp.]